MTAIDGSVSVIARETTIGSATFTTLAEVVDFDGPNFAMETADVTPLGSTTYKTKLPVGKVDIGEATLTINYDPADATHQAFLTDLTGKTLANYRITWGDAGSSETEFNAYVTGFQITNQGADRVTASVTLSGTGTATLPS